MMMTALIIYVLGIACSSLLFWYVNHKEFGEFTKDDVKFVLPFLVISWILFLIIITAHKSVLFKK